MKSISVIIVSWNARDYLRNCLSSIRETGAASVLETIVVDNASQDGSPELVAESFPEVRLIRSTENLGFARANNLAMAHAEGTLFALVNSDVIVHPGCLDTLAAFLDQHPDVGLAAPKIIGGDDKLQRTCRKIPTFWNTACRFLALDRLFPDWYLFSGFEVPRRFYDKCTEAEVLSGCFCVARKKAVDEIGGMDERFFFYAEDIDWCKRFRDRGWKLMFVPDATSTHFGGASTANAPLRYSIEILRATLKYWRKHYGIPGQVLCYLLILGHHGVRFLARGFNRSLGMGRSRASRYKLERDFVCLRWLLTRKEVA